MTKDQLKAIVSNAVRDEIEEWGGGRPGPDDVADRALPLIVAFVADWLFAHGADDGFYLSDKWREEMAS